MISSHAQAREYSTPHVSIVLSRGTLELSMISRAREMLLFSTVIFCIILYFFILNIIVKFCIMEGVKDFFRVSVELL